MVSEIINVLKQNGPMSHAQLARHLNVEVSAMAGMLDLLIDRGRIRLLDTQCSKCKGCLEVQPEDAAIYKVVSVSSPGCRQIEEGSASPGGE